MVAKFKPGDHVRIVNYGRKLWVSNSVFDYHSGHKYMTGVVFLKRWGDGGYIDISPELVGEMAQIREVSWNQKSYSLVFVDTGEPAAWYEEDQLEKVSFLRMWFVRLLNYIKKAG